MLLTKLTNFLEVVNYLKILYLGTLFKYIIYPLRSNIYSYLKSKR